MPNGRFLTMHVIADYGANITFHAENVNLIKHVMVRGPRARFLIWVARLLVGKSAYKECK